MSDVKMLNDDQIKRTYNLVKEYYNKYLKKYNVKIPQLKNHGKYSKSALALVYIAYNYPQNKVISKKELTQFIRNFYPDVNDVQQGRHLGAQKGFWILAGGRNDIDLSIPRGSYKLYTLEEPYPGFTGRRIDNISNWDELKARYDNRCATCGSKEGEKHFHWPGTITKLEKGHMDANKSLEPGNIIPQCQQCNRADRNRWVYDSKGRVIKLADPRFILNSDEKVQKIVYQILKNKFSSKKYEK